MLAFKSALPTTYNSFLTLASLLIAILVTGAGFCIAENNLFRWTSIAAGAVIGTGIAMMHYLGMSAMSISGHIRWDAPLVVASITTGILFAAAAVWSFKVKQSKLLAAGLLTAAICALHFTAMAAATVEFDPTVIVNSPHIDNKLLATAIAGVTMLVILSGLTAALINLETARESQERIKLLRHVADHDHLTGLPNRGFISRTIDGSTNSVSKSGFTLFFVDLDRFKGVNDEHGHVAGDQVLRQAAQRLRRAVCESAVVARAGGDEFLIVQTGSELSSAEKLANVILSSFEQPFEILGGGRALLGVSIGVAFYPRDGHDAESMLRAADLALYRVKRTGGGAATLAA
jgi:diguanylate cyclase (GGDEF)-like protein